MRACATVIAAVALLGCIQAPAGVVESEDAAARRVDLGRDDGPAADAAQRLDAAPPDVPTIEQDAMAAPDLPLIDRDADVEPDRAPIDRDAEIEPDQAPVDPPDQGAPGCADPVGAWQRLDRCLLALDVEYARPRLCANGLMHEVERRSLLDLRADGSFSLTCRQDDLQAGGVTVYCDEAAPSCGVAIDALDPAPTDWACDDPAGESCRCTLVYRATRTVEGQWASDGDYLHLRHAGGQHTLDLDCDAGRSPVRGYHAERCTAAREIEALRSLSVLDVQIAPNDGGYTLLWHDGGVWRAQIDAEGEPLDPPRRITGVPLDADARGPQVRGWALVDGDAFVFEAMEVECRLVHDDGQSTRILAAEVPCIRAPAGARRADGVDLAGLRFGGVWHVAIGETVEARQLWPSDWTYPPAVAQTDRGFAVASGGQLAVGDAPPVGAARWMLNDRLRWDPARRALVAANIDAPERIGHLHVAIYPADGAPIERHLFENIGPGSTGVDIHVEGEGYRIFWGDFVVRIDQLGVRNREIQTMRLDATGLPVSAPQRLTDLAGGTAERPIVFPTPDGYTLFHRRNLRAGREATWAMTRLPHACLDR